MKNKQKNQGKFQGWEIALVVTILLWLSHTLSSIDKGTVKFILKSFGIELSVEIDKQQSVEESLPPGID